MLSKLLRIVFGKRGSWAGMCNRDTIIYYDDDGRKMTIAGQMLNDAV